MVGEVVGITTLYIKGGENLNFAIPINDVKPMLQTSFSKLANFPDKANADEATPSGLTTVHVIGIEHTIITLPGYTVPDYAACMKGIGDWQDGEVKKAAVKECKQLDEIHKSMGTLHGYYYPPRKESGYLVTFETPTALYVVSTRGRCTEMDVNGQCRGEWVPNVVFGQSYTFLPSRIGDTDIGLADPPVKKGAVPEVRLMGHLESVVEKKRAE
jgi:hypothetical protein